MAFRGDAAAIAKLDYARLVAAALAYLVAGQGDAVGLVDLRRHGAAVHSEPRRASRTCARVLAALAKLQPSGATAARGVAASARSICSSAAAC